MAGQTVTLFYVIQDAKGADGRSRVEIDVPTGGLTANYVGMIAPMGELIHDLVTGGLLEAGVTIRVDTGVAFAGWGPIAALASDIQEKAKFAFRTVFGNPKTLSIPTFNEDLFIPGTNDVDTSDPAVAAFVTAMEDGITVNGTVMQPSDSRGESLDQLEAATEAWGKARR